jgi:hypothetical protein
MKDISIIDNGIIKLMTKDIKKSYDENIKYIKNLEKDFFSLESKKNNYFLNYMILFFLGLILVLIELYSKTNFLFNIVLTIKFIIIILMNINLIETFIYMKKIKNFKNSVELKFVKNNEEELISHTILHLIKNNP